MQCAPKNVFKAFAIVCSFLWTKFSICIMNYLRISHYNITLSSAMKETFYSTRHTKYNENYKEVKSHSFTKWHVSQIFLLIQK